MSVRADKPKVDGTDPTAVLSEAATTDASLAEGNSYCVASPENPLKRNLVVSIRASLNDLCLSKSKGTWAPTTEALKSIFQQKKFTSLDGSADAQGDLKSVVLHDLKVQHASSNFPVSLGAKITGVDDTTFSSTGDSFSMIVLPHSNSANERTLQSDDVSLAYEFAKKFPVSLGLESLYRLRCLNIAASTSALTLPGCFALYLAFASLLCITFLRYRDASSGSIPESFSSSFASHVVARFALAASLSGAPPARRVAF